MRAKLLFTLTIVLAFTFRDLYGQKDCCCGTGDKTDSEPYLSGELSTPVSSADPATYFNQEWLPGDIYLTNGEVARNRLLKYSGLVDELFWKVPGSNSIIKLDKELIERFHFLNFNGDTSVSFQRIKIKRNIITDSSEVLGQVIYEGSLSLFVLHAFLFEGSEVVYIDGIPCQKNIYAEKLVYIFSYDNNKTFVTRSLSRKSLYSFSPDNKDKIKEFLKSNDMGKSVNNSYLIRLTQFLGTLVKQ